MKQAQFEKMYQDDWADFEKLLLSLDEKKAQPNHTSGYAVAYRRICRNLSIARNRCYSSELIDRLNRLALRGHHHFYKPRPLLLSEAMRWFLQDFPQAVRAEYRLVLLNALLFYGPIFCLILLIWDQPEMVYAFMSQEEVQEFEMMYSKAQSRGFSADFAMFGFYVKNNVGIAFVCFATGIFVGIGSIFYLFYNGIAIGAAFGHMLHVPQAEHFFPFVITHGAFELNALVLSGVAGFRLGLALIAPGNLSRKRALQKAGETAIPIVYGMATMLVGAALIEAFWSPRVMPAAIKYSVGGLFWLFTFLYFLLAGRRHAN